MRCELSPCKCCCRHLSPECASFFFSFFPFGKASLCFSIPLSYLSISLLLMSPSFFSFLHFTSVSSPRLSNVCFDQSFDFLLISSLTSVLNCSQREDSETLLANRTSRKYLFLFSYLIQECFPPHFHFSSIPNLCLIETSYMMHTSSRQPLSKSSSFPLHSLLSCFSPSTVFHLHSSVMDLRHALTGETVDISPSLSTVSSWTSFDISSDITSVSSDQILTPVTAESGFKPFEDSLPKKSSSVTALSKVRTVAWRETSFLGNDE